MSGIAFRHPTEPEIAERNRQIHAWMTESAWGYWREYLCAETRRAPDGEHPWVLEVDEGHASIRCEHGCGANSLAGPDNDVWINVSVPVTVDIQAGRYPTDYGDEWDVYVTIEPDPARIR